MCTCVYEWNILENGWVFLCITSFFYVEWKKSREIEPLNGVLCKIDRVHDDMQINIPIYLCTYQYVYFRTVFIYSDIMNKNVPSPLQFCRKESDGWNEM